jgi:two-component system heavy metal sensor histidine kinase CusS
VARTPSAGSRPSLAARLTLLYVAASSLLLLVLGVLLGVMLRGQLEARDREELEGKTELIEYLFTELETGERIAQESSRFGDAVVGHPHLQIGVRDERGWLLAPPAAFRDAMVSTGRAVPAAPGVATVSFPDGQWWLRRVDFGTADGRRFTAYLALHVDPAQQLVARFRGLMLVAGALGVLASGLLGWIVAKRGLAPLTAIGREAERVTAQHLGPFLRAQDAPSEIRGLVEAINRMLGRLADSFRGLEEFSADIAHELRTPLHNLMLQTQVTLSRPRGADEYKDALHSNLEELEHLQRMVSDMLFLARADRGMFELKVEPVDLREEAEKVAEFFEVAAAETGKTIDVTGAGVAAGDRAMVRRALTNLFSNAVRHSLPASRIDVRISPTAEGGCEVDVFNPAHPLGDAELRRMFGRFARGERSGASAGEGSGLGLSIVASIMRLHRGEARAEAVPGGLLVRLVFRPASPASPLSAG